MGVHITLCNLSCAPLGRDEPHFKLKWRNQKAHLPILTVHSRRTSVNDGNKHEAHRARATLRLMVQKIDQGSTRLLLLLYQ